MHYKNIDLFLDHINQEIQRITKWNARKIAGFYEDKEVNERKVELEDMKKNKLKQMLKANK